NVGDVLLSEGYASHGTDVGFARDFDGPVVHGDGCHGEGILRSEFGYGGDAKDGAGGGVDGQLAVIAGQPIDPVGDVGCQAEGQVVVGFFGGNKVAEDGD